MERIEYTPTDEQVAVWLELSEEFEDDEPAPPCLFCGQPVEEEPNECNSLYHALAYARGPITDDMYAEVMRETLQYYADRPDAYEPGAMELIAANPAAVEMFLAEQGYEGFIEE